MTGSAVPSDEELRGQLIAALVADWGCEPDDIDANGAAAGAVDDVLLPVVRRYADQRAAAVLRAAAQEQRNEAENVPDIDEGTHAEGHRCAADFLDRRVALLERRP